MLQQPEIDTDKNAKVRFAAWALMLGNVLIGLCVLAPAAMLNELSEGLGTTIRDAGLLVTFGAVVLCVGSPLMAWATARIDRRLLLFVTLAVVAAGHVASAFAPNYATLLGIRLVMLAVAVIYTPQAAGTIALIVPEKDRASAIAFVFLGWTVSIAAGLPIITSLAANLGWREAYAVLGFVGALCAALLWIGLPAGVRGTPISFQSWSRIAHHRTILLLLLITILNAAGSFVLFTYLGPLLSKLAGAGAREIAIFFAISGVMGFVGNVIATRLVRIAGAFATSFLSILSGFIGAVIWSIGAGSLAVMGLSMFPSGLGFAAANSMQQARLVAAAPELASASVALNTSSIYIGQAVGSAIGGFLYANNFLFATGYAATAFIGAALLVLMLTRRVTK